MQDVPCRVSYSIGWSSVVPALSARKVREQNGTCRMPQVCQGQDECGAKRDSMYGLPDGVLPGPSQPGVVPAVSARKVRQRNRAAFLLQVPQRQDERRPKRNNMFGLQHRPLLQHERQRHVHKVSDRQVCERQCLQNMPHLSRRMDPER